METTIRSAQTAAFSMSKTEQDIYDDCTDWIEERIGAASSDVSNEDRLFPFVLMSRQREMDSCLPAAIARWKNMIAGYESDDDSENETLTDYLGSDPEFNYSYSESRRGFDYAKVALPITIKVGFNLNF